MIRILGFDSWQGLVIFLLTTVHRMALGPNQPCIQWVVRALSLGIKQLGHEADLVLRSRMRGAVPPLLQYVFMAWSLVKHRDYFTFAVKF
jgi:hypothetical protein